MQKCSVHTIYGEAPTDCIDFWPYVTLLHVCHCPTVDIKVKNLNFHFRYDKMIDQWIHVLIVFQ